MYLPRQQKGTPLAPIFCCRDYGRELIFLNLTVHKADRRTQMVPRTCLWDPILILFIRSIRFLAYSGRVFVPISPKILQHKERKLTKMKIHSHLISNTILSLFILNTNGSILKKG